MMWTRAEVTIRQLINTGDYKRLEKKMNKKTHTVSTNVSHIKISTFFQGMCMHTVIVFMAIDVHYIPLLPIENK